VLGRPKDNDKWNRNFSTRHGVLVIALNYRKAPAYPFPAAIHDLAELVALCVADTSLPIDHSRGVAIAGWSSGGTLALATAALLRQSGSRVPLRAVIPMYAALDFAVPAARKQQMRRKKPLLGGMRARDADVTPGIAPIFDWAYIPAGTDRHDPRLSPFYGMKDGVYDGLHVFVIACELDRLANDSWRLASALAGRAVPDVDEAPGQESIGEEGELVLDDERFSFESATAQGTPAATCRWLLVPDTIHGYDSFSEREVDDPDMLRDAQAKANKVMDIVGQWVLTGPCKNVSVL